MRLPALAIVLMACGGPPPLTIKYKLSADPNQQCMIAKDHPAETCSDVALPCPTYLSIRIVSPKDPTQAFVSVCQPVINGHDDLCSIAGIDLPDGVSVAEQTLQVQVALYDASSIRDMNGDIHCPANPQFSPNGLPVTERSLTGDPPPAVGGSAYYHPGDEQTVVELGCTDPPALQACMVDDSVLVTASVNDFDQGFTVGTSVANALDVLVGEPGQNLNPDEFVLSPSNTWPLDRTVSYPPQWGATIAPPVAPLFTSSACIEVLEDAGEIRPTLACKQVTPSDKNVSLTGARVQLSTIDSLLKLVDPSHMPTLPARGIVIGMVVDNTGAPVRNVNVTADNPMTTNPMITIDYVSADRTQLVTGTVTTPSGIFISPDAPYGTTFTAHGTSMLQTATGFGGLVHGKVDVVVLQFDHPQGN